VAVAPFTTMRDEVPDYLRTALPGVGAAISDETFQQAIDEAGLQAQSDPDLANAAEAIGRAEANVLIMHGTADWLVPPGNAMRLQQAAPDRCEVVFMPWQGHVSIWFDPTGEVAERARNWFDWWL
jgi:pimeloyl-ACP methyl ester carboxylesterase